MGRRVRPGGCIFLGAVLLLLVIRLFPPRFVEQKAHVLPPYPQKDLSLVLTKSHLSAADYQLLYEQSGLGKTAIDHLLQQEHGKEKILEFQKHLFREVNFVCEANSIISNEERLVAEKGETQTGTEFAELKNGYVLVTKASHTLCWRNGHAAIVVDAEAGKTLESVVLGTNSCLQSIDKWLHYPNFIVLKLKAAPPQLLNEIASFAKNKLNDLPYSLTVGIFSAKNEQTHELSGTQCAHLVWRAFMEFGYDLDSNQGNIVTPKDLVNSPLFEIVQVYGMDPHQPWP